MKNDEKKEEQYDKEGILYLEKVLIDEATKEFSGRNYNHQLIERKKILNQAFVFDEKNIRRLEEINHILDIKSKQAYIQAQRAESLILKEMNSGASFISDYEILFEVSLFAEKKYAHFKEMEGNPFFKFEPFLFFFIKKENFDPEMLDSMLNKNHSEIDVDNECALYHDLFDHTYLSLQDAIDTEEIWIEVKIIIQNFTNTEKKTNEKREPRNKSQEPRKTI